jgi:hypothetical protein
VSGTFRFTALPRAATSTATPTGTASPTASATGTVAATDPTSPATTPVASSTSTHGHEDDAGGPGRVLLLVLFVGAALSAGTIVLAKRRQREAS